MQANADYLLQLMKRQIDSLLAGDEQLQHLTLIDQKGNAQNERLQQYCDANKLLIDCLNSACCVSPQVRQSIENALLLSG